MKCEYCELRRVGPFVISKACTMLSGKIINKQTGDRLKNFVCTTWPTRIRV